LHFSLDKKEKSSIVSQTNSAIIRNTCLLHLLLVNGKDILGRKFLDTPGAVIPENPGM
jgi:hypothetical protein